MKKILSFIFLLLALAGHSQNAFLDSTFSSDGIFTYDHGGHNDAAYAVAVQPDDKFIVGGYGYESIHNWFQFILFRFNQNGTIDTTFDSDGMVATNVYGTANTLEDIALQPDGKIIAGGNSSPHNPCFLRYLPNGKVDSTFTTTVLGFDYNMRTFSKLALQTDGKVIAAGYGDVVTALTIGNFFSIARITATGKLDTTFNHTGYTTISFRDSISFIEAQDERAYAVVQQPDGKIVATGYSDSASGNFDYLVLARFKPNGTPDSTFGSNGRVIARDGNYRSYGRAIVLQPDGKIVIGGNGDGEDFLMARFNTNGTPDPTFGINGYKRIDIGGAGDRISALSLLPNGQFIAGGTVYTGSRFNFAVARFNNNGSLDSTFGINGIISTVINNGLCADKIYDIGIQSNGKIIAAGETLNETTNYSDMAVVRYLHSFVLTDVDFEKWNGEFLVYPNPIQRDATLEYTLNKEETISISLFDVKGCQVQPIINNEVKIAGSHKLNLQLNNEIESGIYFLKISNGKNSFTIRIIKQTF